jgi:NAD(P)-dependent dehydrogenase (short-subunit alcohol dehydrogenase family)
MNVRDAEGERNARACKACLHGINGLPLGEWSAGCRDWSASRGKVAAPARTRPSREQRRIIIREGSDSPNAARNWQRTIDVNGTFYVTQVFLPAVRAKRGTIVNVASIVGDAGQFEIAPVVGSISRRKRWTRVS